MAFERDFVERFKEDGRNALINYHKGLKIAHLNMVPVVNSLMEITKPGDQRFSNHFQLQAQREEHNLMSLIGPPDRADHEMVTVSPQIGHLIYSAYAMFNSARTEQLRPTAPPEVIAHLVKVTALLEHLAETAKNTPIKTTVPTAFLNLAYDSVLAEADPVGYETAMKAH